MFVPCYVVLCFVFFLVLHHLDGQESVGYLPVFAFLVSCDCYCSVVLPHCTMNYPVVCDCGIS